MTDSRLPDHWLFNPELDKLSHEAWRVLTRALMYCNGQGTDGEIDTLFMRYVFPYGDWGPYVEELIQIGWMERTPQGLRIPDWEGRGQSPASQVRAYRENARLRQQKSRAKKKASENRSVTGDVTRDVGQEQDRNRTGQDSDKRTSWPAITKPGSSQEVRNAEV